MSDWLIRKSSVLCPRVRNLAIFLTCIFKIYIFNRTILDIYQFVIKPYLNICTIAVFKSYMI